MCVAMNGNKLGEPFFANEIMFETCIIFKATNQPGVVFLSGSCAGSYLSLFNSSTYHLFPPSMRIIFQSYVSNIFHPFRFH